MGYIWLIALVLFIWIGFKAAFTFLELAYLGAIIVIAVGSTLRTVSELKKGNIWSALCWVVPAIVFGKILIMCF